MSTSNLTTTRREPGQPERRNPLTGKQATPTLRSQAKSLSRDERSRRQIHENRLWERKRANSRSSLPTAHDASGLHRSVAPPTD
jgi:hypothetical protein